MSCLITNYYSFTCLLLQQNIFYHNYHTVGITSIYFLFYARELFYVILATRLKLVTVQSFEPIDYIEDTFVNNNIYIIFKTLNTNKSNHMKLLIIN